MAKRQQKKSPGPEPDHLKIEGEWEDAVDQALGKKRPEKGWPEKDEPEHEGDERQDDQRDE